MRVGIRGMQATHLFSGKRWGFWRVGGGSRLLWTLVLGCMGLCGWVAGAGEGGDAWSIEHETLHNVRDMGSMENWLWTLGTNRIAIMRFPRWDMKEAVSKRELEVFDRAQSFRIFLRSYGLAEVPKSGDWVGFLKERHPGYRLVNTPLNQASGYGPVTVLDFVRAKEDERLRPSMLAYRVAMIPVGDRVVECGIRSALSNLLDKNGEPTSLGMDFGRFLVGFRPRSVLEASRTGEAGGK